MSTLYIDITQLVNWQGKLTGIPRVIHELSVRYRKEDNVIFVVWDKASSRFQTTSPDNINRSASQVMQNSTSTNNSNTKKLARRLLPSKIRTVIKKTASQHRNTSLQVSRLKFKTEDKLLILWGEWADQSYIDNIIKLNQKGVGIIQVAYDMLPIITPQYSGHSTNSLTNYARSIYPICELILSISKNTKKDVDGWLREIGQDVPPNKVFRLGDDFAFAKPVKPSNQFFSSATKDFVLMVGTVEARKNHALMYYTYKLAKQRGITLPKLVVVGRRGWNTENIYELMTLDPETKDDFLFLHDASDEELSWLYSHCAYSVYPSLYEGWGLPIAESLARGVPCAASNTSSMTEISDKGVVYFSPVSTDECLNSLLRLQDRQELIKLKEGAKSYEPYRWDQTFNAVHKAIGDL